MTANVSHIGLGSNSVVPKITLALFLLAGSFYRELWRTDLTIPLSTKIQRSKNKGIHTCRVGVSFRQVNVDFSPNARIVLPGGGANQQFGPGDVGLFTAVSGNIVYEDGTVGPQIAGNPNGDASYTVNNASQISNTSPLRQFAGVNVREATFTSSESTLNGGGAAQGRGLIISDEETNAAPYFQLVFPIDGLDGATGKNAIDDKFKNFTIGYTYLDSGAWLWSSSNR